MTEIIAKFIGVSCLTGNAFMVPKNIQKHEPSFRCHV